MTTPLTSSKRRRLTGVVVSTKMALTAVVRIDREVAHKKYGKYFAVSKKFKVHDPARGAKLGDLIEIEECRPLSRDKCWRYIRTVKAGVPGLPPETDNPSVR